MKKIVCIALAIILCLVAYFGGGMYYFRWKRIKNMHESTQNMLDMVRIPDASRPELLDYVYRKDPLSYVSAYELMAARIDMDEVPEGWVLEQARIDELEAVTAFYVQEDAFSELELDLPPYFDAYYFAEIGSHEEYESWEYYIALYSGEGLLLIYRGHDLHSDLMDRIAGEPSSDESYWEFISKA